MPRFLEVLGAAVSNPAPHPLPLIEAFPKLRAPFGDRSYYGTFNIQGYQNGTLILGTTHFQDPKLYTLNPRGAGATGNE